jgi:DNA transformation protein and related proteins
MDPERIEELFSPVGPIFVKRMFGGHGIYAGDLFIAIETGGEIYLKVDAETQPLFEAAGSSPFAYTRANAQKPIVMSYWRLAETAYEDADEFRRWILLASDAARRVKASKARLKRKGSIPQIEASK